jgi:hypothetical protein
MAKQGSIIVLIVLLCLFNLVSVSPVITFPEEVSWHQGNIPLEGENGGWLLAEGSDVRHLAITDDGATMVGLWLSGNRIWSIDTTNLRLMTFIDSLAQPVSLESPLNQESGVGTVVNGIIEDVKLDWQTLGGATSYQWQLDDDSSFSSIPEGFEDSTMASSVRLPHLEPDTTYYWRERANKPLLSP